MINDGLKIMKMMFKAKGPVLLKNSIALINGEAVESSTPRAPSGISHKRFC
jgi:hypothetical protein